MATLTIVFFVGDTAMPGAQWAAALLTLSFSTSTRHQMLFVSDRLGVNDSYFHALSVRVGNGLCVLSHFLLWFYSIRRRWLWIGLWRRYRWVFSCYFRSISFLIIFLFFVSGIFVLSVAAIAEMECYLGNEGRLPSMWIDLGGHSTPKHPELVATSHRFW
jgi:hypothetical protein